LTLEAIRDRREMIHSHSKKDVYFRVRDSLQYRKSLFQSTQLRLNSLDRRMQNIISLVSLLPAAILALGDADRRSQSFNLVTQQDSRIMQKDSSSMKTIAMMTLLFLPASAISTVFGSQFFDFSGDNGRFRVAPMFWLYWVITIPVTIFVLGFWQWYYRRAKKKLMLSDVV